MQYTNWAPNQPDNAGGNEHCVEWINFLKKWNDRGCNEHSSFACEKRCSNVAPDQECVKRNQTLTL